MTFRGLDVLFYSDTAQQYVPTVPERIYMWLALIAAVLLNAATLVTRSALIAYLTWFFSGAAMFYSVFAIWMRQSRPPTEPGVGPSFGLIIGTVSVSVVAAALSFVVLRRNSFQAAANHPSDYGSLKMANPIWAKHICKTFSGCLNSIIEAA